jgi:lactoylglutathione lyase
MTAMTRTSWLAAGVIAALTITGAARGDEDMQTARFGYTIVYVADVAATTAFYGKAFGLRPRFEHPSGAYAELETGETALAFVSHDQAGENLPGGFQPLSADGPPAGIEIALVFDDVPAAFAQAVEAGAAAVAEPAVKPWGQTVAYVRDPDGTLVELASPMGEPASPRPHHVLTILAVTDLQAMAGFYDEALGWPRRVDVPVFVEFELPDGRGLGVYQREGFAQNTGVAPAVIPDGAISGTEIYLHCPDLEGAIERMKAAGARELAPLAPRDWGDEAAYFADPEGHVLVLARPLGGPEMNRGDLMATVGLAIQLLADGRHADFLRQVVHPNELAEIIEHESFEALVAEFGQRKAEQALTALRLCRTIEPTMSDGGTHASFVIPRDQLDLPSGPLEFVRFEGKWYLTN